MKPLPIVFLLLLMTGINIKSLNSQDIAPQIWNNAGVAWNINKHFAWRNYMAYNALLSSDYPWDEFTVTSTGVYKFKRFFEATFGIYTARSRQTETIKSFEIRPFAGFRASTNNAKRWSISNLSRLEIRQMFYSRKDNVTGFRFRNRTYAGVSLNKPSMNFSKNNLVLFSYFEAFFNFGEEVRERFFNQFKYKLGLAYRFNSSWGIDLGVIYQDAKNNVKVPVQAPTNLITYLVIEWGVVFVIGKGK